MDCVLILTPAYNGCSNILYPYNIMKYKDAFHGSNLKHSTVYKNKTVTCYNLIGAKNMV